MSACIVTPPRTSTGFINSMMTSSTSITKNSPNQAQKSWRPSKRRVSSQKKPFDDKIEWTWFYLWHHEGRRARHGASMMAPDYAHWHGMYEVSERFYMEFLPEAMELLHHSRTAGAKRVKNLIQSLLERPEHRWIKGNKNYLKKSAP